jgi:type II secretory pathway component PulK
MNVKQNHRSGFAIATAMFMIAIVAVAMAAVGALLAADVRRTLNGTADAQLRQLLVAAEIDAPAHLSDLTQETWTTALPPSLAEGHVETTRLPATDGAELRVSASIADRALIEQLHFDHSPNGWRLKAAELFPSTSRRW